MVPNLWLAALLTGAIVAVLGGIFERLILRKLSGNVLGQVLVTLGVSFIIADLCLVVWGGDPIPVPTPQWLQQPLRHRRPRVSRLPPGRGGNRCCRRDRFCFF